MAWLHTWGGLLAGWLLFAIFFTGSLGVFDDAITRWMKPEAPAVELRDWDRASLVRMGQSYLEETVPRSHFWSIGLPTKDIPVIRLFYEDEQEQFQSERLNPATGEPMPNDAERETEGGHHFVHMHYEFHAGTAGVWLVGVFTMAMLVALVSGVIIHKRIFKDFFSFRPGKGQRSWLDAHNAVSVLSLPFLFMIAYTGLATFYSLYMPAAIEVHYPEEGSFFAELLDQPRHRPETDVDAAVVPLDGLLLRAEAEMGRAASFVVVEHPGDSSAAARVFGVFDEAEARGKLLPGTSGRVEFDAVNGELWDVQVPGEIRGGAATATQAVMRTLHFAGFGGYTVRWLYFLLGMAGAAMMATGAILVMVKRRQKSLREFGIHTPRVYRLVEVLNVGSIAGLALSCIAMLWLNRLIPIGIEDRAAWEIRGFFLVWALTLLHAALRPAGRAWVEQLLVCAALCLTLPVLNALTTGSHVLVYWAQGDGPRLGVELTVIVFGLLCGLGAYGLLRRQRQARPLLNAARPPLLQRGAESEARG
ncbi:PepSY domain-containing protein [Kineobactrum salinum]|uniref:PepSY domain-containing protein n=2 Tax=Kineobactrum salinum TaxID=2708301 RepID=A0A6C0U5U6_9GAMM|nr:PepSY domain-containing protein [Kineobactrum salinum]